MHLHHSNSGSSSYFPPTLLAVAQHGNKENDDMLTSEPSSKRRKFQRLTGFDSSIAARNASRDANPFLMKRGAKKSFTQQFSHIYYARLHLLRPCLMEQAQSYIATVSTQPKPRLCKNVLDIHKGELCILIGTLYKDMKLKPSILDEYTKAKAGEIATSAPMTSRTQAAVDSTTDCLNYCSASDCIVMEDETGRLALVPEDECEMSDDDSVQRLQVDRYVSGLIVAVLGKEDAQGQFRVQRVFVPGLAPQKSLSPSKGNKPRYLMLTSGLAFGSHSGSVSATPIARQMMMDYVSGYLGSEAEHAFQAQIYKCIIAGCSLQAPKRDNDTTDDAPAAVQESTQTVLQPLQQLDCLLTELCASVPVHLMPGASDPANFTLPQQPMHNCLFPSASMYQHTFSSETNPVLITEKSTERGELHILGTSGQNIQDMLKYTNLAPKSSQPAPSSQSVPASQDTALQTSDATLAIDLLESCLHWRLLAPTAPDTLACYPYTSVDPFVSVLRDSCPHILFAGNMASFQTRLVKGTQGQQCRIVGVPSFAATGQIVLIDVESPDLAVHAIQFAGAASDASAADGSSQH